MKQYLFLCEMQKIMGRVDVFPRAFRPRSFYSSPIPVVYLLDKMSFDYFRFLPFKIVVGEA